MLILCNPSPDNLLHKPLRYRILRREVNGRSRYVIRLEFRGELSEDRLVHHVEAEVALKSGEVD